VFGCDAVRHEFRPDRHQHDNDDFTERDHDDAQDGHDTIGIADHDHDDAPSPSPSSSREYEYQLDAHDAQDDALEHHDHALVEFRRDHAAAAGAVATTRLPPRAR